MKAVSDTNYKTHNIKITNNFSNSLLFGNCADCGLDFAFYEEGIWSSDDISCKEYLIKNIIE